MSAISADARAHSAKARSTEGELRSMMLAGLNGDGKAYATLLRQVTPLLRSFFARRMRDDARDVEDLVQEALIAVHTRRGSFDRERAFTPWLFSIARHKLVDYFRHSHRHQPIEGLEDILVTEGFEQSSDAAMDLNRLLAGLPDKQARAIRETKILGMSVTEVAQRAGISVSDVKVSVHRGLKTLAGCASTGHC